MMPLAARHVSDYALLIGATRAIEGQQMDTPKAIIFAAAIVGASILLSSGIYSFSPGHLDGISYRYNKFTGSVFFCVLDQGCRVMEPEKTEKSANAEIQKNPAKSDENIFHDEVPDKEGTHK